MKKKLTKKLTFKYTNIQIQRSLLTCIISGYVAVFLKHKGFVNTEIGIALSAAAILSIIIQPLLASFADKTTRFSLTQITMFTIALNIMFGAIMLVGNNIKSVIFISYILAGAIQITLNSLVNSLAVEYINKGIPINFGLARGSGSMMFALFSIFLGYFLEKYSPNFLIIMYLLFYILMFFFVYSYRMKADYNKYLHKTDSNMDENNHKSKIETNNNKAGKNDKKRDIIASHESSSTIQFLRENKRYTVFLLGIMLMFYSDTVINTYFINIVENVGGNSSNMGVAMAIAAALELPVMAGFTYLLRKFKCSSLVRFSAIFFFAKAFIFFIAPNIPTIYLAQILQVFSFAVFTPASVYYASAVVPEKDSVKGQTMINVATFGLAGVVGNLTGGILQDTYGVTAMLLVSTLLTGLGTLIVLISTEETPMLDLS